MSRLVFSADDLRRVIAHAVSAKSFGKGFGGASGSLILVHDDGVYLMSNGEPPDLVDGAAARRYCAYALGCNPTRDPNFYETAHDLVGGDDFAEHLPWAGRINTMLHSGAKTVTITITPKQLALEPLNQTMRGATGC